MSPVTVGNMLLSHLCLSTGQFRLAKMIIFPKSIGERNKNTGVAGVEKEGEEGQPCREEGRKLPKL